MLVLPDNIDKDFLKYEIIYLNSRKAKAINKILFRLMSVFKAIENKFFHVFSIQIEWSALIIADLYMKRWDI